MTYIPYGDGRSLLGAHVRSLLAGGVGARQRLQDETNIRTLGDTVEYLSLSAPVANHFDPTSAFPNTPFEVIPCTNWFFFAEGLEQITRAAMTGQIQRRNCYLLSNATFDRSTSINSPSYTYFPNDPVIFLSANNLTGFGGFSILTNSPSLSEAHYRFQGNAIIDLPNQSSPAGAVFTNLRLITNLTTPTTATTFVNTTGAALWFGVEFGSAFTDVGTATNLTIVASIRVKNAP